MTTYFKNFNSENDFFFNWSHLKFNIILTKVREASV